MPPDDRSPAREGPLRGTLLALGAQLTTAAFTAVLTIFLVRQLGAAGYGLFALAMSVGAIAVLVADLGISFSTSRFLAERHADDEAAADVLAAGLRLKLVFATVAALLLFALAGPIAAAYGKPGMTWPLRGIAVSIWGETVMALFTSSFQALRRLGLNVRIFLVESLAEISASAGLVLAGAGVAGAAFGRAIGYAVGAAVAAVIAGRLLGRRALELRERRRDLEREIARYGRPLVATNSAYTLFGTIDIQLIGALLSSRAVGLFAAPLKLVTFFSYVGQSAANAIAPRMAGADPDVRSFTNALRGLLILQWLVIVPVVVWAQPLLVLALGEEFRPAGEVLQLLAPYVFLRGLSPLITVTVNYLGEAGRRVKLVIACLLLNAAIDAVLLPTIGVIGAAIGTSVSYLVYVPAHLRICRESFDLPLRPLALTLMRAALAAAAAAGVLALFGTRELSAWEFAAGSIGAVAAFMAVLGLTGEVGRSDIERVASVIRQRANRPG